MIISKSGGSKQSSQPWIDRQENMDRATLIVNYSIYFNACSWSYE